MQIDGVSQDTLDRADRYETFFRIEFVVSQLVLIGVLILYAKHGARFAKESAAGRIGTGMLLGMIGLAFVWLSQVPFRLAEVWWDRRYDQTDSGYLETLFANWFELGAEFLFICFALVVVMALAGAFPRRWWLAAAPFFIGLAALFSFIYPYLTPTEPLDRSDLVAAGREYAEKQGIDPIPLRVEDVTDFTSAPNAYAAGFGPTKRIVFWNTLLDGSFTDNEVKTVLAHEIGHHSSNHIIEGTRVVRALRSAGRLADRGRDPATRRHGEPGRGAGLVARDRRAQSSLDSRLQPDLAPHGGGGRLESTRDHPRSGIRGSPLQAVHDPVAERPRSADLVLPALRQPPLRREEDRDGRGVETPR